MPLLDLPNELLTQISKSIPHEADINAFAQTNRLLYTITNSHLYHHNAQHSASSTLLWAAAEGRENTVRLCLDNGADPTTSIEWNGIDGVTPLYLAAARDRLSVVKLLLGQQAVELRTALVVADLLSPGGDRTLLSWAAEKGSTQVVEFLVSIDGVDPDAEDAQGATPLWRAAERARADVVRVLLGTGRVDVNFAKEAEDEEWEARTVLSAADWALRMVFEYGPNGRATAEDCDETVKLLLAHEEVEVEFRPFPDQQTRAGNHRPTNMASLLYHTAQVGPAEIVELLLRRGDVDCDAFTGGDRTLLSWAASSGQAGAVRALVKRGAEIDSRDRTGRTPLSWAAGTGYSETVQCLLELGAEVDLEDWDGATPLWFAVQGGAEDAAKALRAHGAAMPNIEPSDVPSLLQDAVSSGNPTIAALLLETGIDPNVRDKDGRTPLAIAAHEGQISIVELLLNKKDVDPDARNKQGSTPLHEAVSGSHVGAIKLLLADPRVNINIKDYDGDDAVGKAATELLGTDKDEFWEKRAASMMLLLSHQKTIIESDNDTLPLILWYAVEQDSPAMTGLILKRWGNDILMTEEAVIGAAVNARNEVLELVFEQYKPEITEDILKAAARNVKHGQAVMEFLLDQQSVRISEDVLNAAVANTGCGKQIMALFVDRHHRIQLSEAVVRTAARKGGAEIMEFILALKGENFVVTEGVVQSAAGNKEHGGDILSLLLTRSVDVRNIKNILKAAITNAGNGRNVMQALLAKFGGSCIDEEIINAVVQHWKTGEAVLDLCISQYRDQGSAVEAVIDAAARNTRYGFAVVQYLFGQMSPISISRSGLLTAIGHFDKRALTLVSDHCSPPIQIDDEVVKAAAKNRYGKAVVGLLLEQNRKIQLSKEMFKTLEGEKPSGKWIVRLLRQRGVKPA
jgi:ankyrin repeat protein